MIKWYKEDVGNGCQNNMIAWAEVNNYHIDEVLAENSEEFLYLSKKYKNNEIYLNAAILFLKSAGIAYVMYTVNADGKSEEYPTHTTEADNLVAYAKRQYNNLKEKLCL